MIIAGFAGLVILTVLCLVGAGIVYLYKPGTLPRLNYLPFYWAAIMSGMVFALLWSGSQTDYGRRLSLEVTELRLPIADIAENGVYFIAGPRVETSDLVVGPYAATDLSQEAYRADFEGLLTIRREASVWEVCGKRVEADKAANLPGMVVSIDGVALEKEECRPLSSSGTSVLISRLDPGVSEPAKRRYLTLSLDDQRVTIGLKGNEHLVRDLGRCTDGDLSQPLRLEPAGLHSFDMGYRVPENLVFEQLGQGGTHPLLAPEQLGPIGTIDSLCANTGKTFTWPAADAQSRLVLKSKSTWIGWWTGVLVLVFTLFMVRVCRSVWAEAEGRTEARVTMALTWLLVLRTMMALSGLPNDPSLSLPDLLWPPAMALICLPLLTIALTRRYSTGTARNLGLLALAVPVGVLFTAYSLDWHMPGKQEIILALVTLFMMLARALTNLPEPISAIMARQAKPALTWLVTLVLKIADWVDRRVRPDAARLDMSMRSDPLIMGMALGIAIVTLRFAVALIGKRYDPPIWQERFNDLPLVDNLPISLFYAPLSIIAIALMIAGYRARPSLVRAVLLSATFGAVFLGIGAFVSDVGIILIFAIPAGWAIAALVWQTPSGNFLMRQTARALLLFPLFSPLLMLGGFYALWGTGPIPSPNTDLKAHMEVVTDWKPNLARLQRLIDPDKLVDVGNKAAFGMLDQAAQLEPLTGGYIGVGYLEQSGIIRPLLNYQYSDNQLAVQVAWPFGRLGLVVMLGGLLLMLVGLRGTGAVARSNHWLFQASTIAATTLFWSGAYMAMANLNLVPFTGRNFYLLAARSMGDLAEGFVLIMMVVLPFLVFDKPGIGSATQKETPIATRPEVLPLLGIFVAVLFLRNPELPRETALKMPEDRGYRAAVNTLARRGCIIVRPADPDTAAGTAPRDTIIRNPATPSGCPDKELFESYAASTALGSDMVNLIASRWVLGGTGSGQSVMAIRPNTHRLRFSDSDTVRWRNNIVAATPSSRPLPARMFVSEDELLVAAPSCSDQRIDGVAGARNPQVGQFLQCRTGSAWRMWQVVSAIGALSEVSGFDRRSRHPVLSSVLRQTETPKFAEMKESLVATIQMPLQEQMQALLNDHLEGAITGSAVERTPRAGILLMDGLTGEIAAAPSYPALARHVRKDDLAGHDFRRLNWNFEPLPAGSTAKVPFAAAVLEANPALGKATPRFMTGFCTKRDYRCKELAVEGPVNSVELFVQNSSNAYALWLMDKAFQTKQAAFYDALRRFACIEPMDDEGDPSCSRYLWRTDAPTIPGGAVRGLPQPLLTLDMENRRGQTDYASWHLNILGGNRSVWSSANLGQAYARIASGRAVNPRLTPADGEAPARLEINRNAVWGPLMGGMEAVLVRGTAKDICRKIGCSPGSNAVNGVWLYGKTGTPRVADKRNAKVLVLLAARTRCGRKPAKPEDIVGLKVIVITQRFSQTGRDATDLAAGLFRNDQFQRWLKAGTPSSGKEACS